jgi:glycosyltransferase involved in cell wall biosynthesis
VSAPRVLLVAENASTRFGGEAILPYHYFRLLKARGIDAHLIVHARTRDELLTHFPGDASLHFVEDQLLQKLFFRLGNLLPHRLSEATFGLANQLLTQSAQRRLVRRLTTANCVVHQPIPVSPRFPSLLYDLGAPVAIGPLNGGMEYPVAFRGAESGLSRVLIAIGRSFTDVVNAIFPGKRRAAVVLVANRRTREALPSHLRGRVIELPENAVDTTRWKALGDVAEENPNRFVFIGRLVDWKALDIVLEALQVVPDATLDVIGDGPMLATWRDLAGQLGLAQRVRFHGWRTQAECSKFLAGCAALVLPSIYECGGAVVLEAMAMSRPVIATAWGGPLDYLDASCGILVEPSSRAALVAGFSQAVRQLMESPELRRSMGAAGRSRLLSDFDWNRKIDRMLQIYESILTQ